MNAKKITFGFLYLVGFVIVFGGVVYNAQDFLGGGGNEQGGKDIFLGSILEGTNMLPYVESKDTGTDAPNPNITSEAAIAAEINTSGSNAYPNRIIFEKSGNSLLPIASLTKLMTAVIVLDNCDLSKDITVDAVADSQDRVANDVAYGDTMPAGDFLKIMLIESSNRSAYTLAEMVGEQKFVALMNEKAKALGLNNTTFVDPTGLSDQDVATAEDLMKLAEYILRNYPVITDISKTRSLDVTGFGTLTNTDQLLGEFQDIIFSKTGFTDQAKGCLLLVIDNTKQNDYLINIILGADDRFAQMRTLINWETSVYN